MSLPRDSVAQNVVDLFMPIFRAATSYHDYRVIGLDHVPESGPAIIVFTHSLATYDIILFSATLYFEKKRLIASLADRAIFKTPGLRQMAELLGAVEGEPRIARELLATGRLLGVAPGGMREALRAHDKRYQTDWARRTGFVRLAIESQAKIILAACPAADEAFYVFDNPLTRFVYDKFRLPLPVALGEGILPKRVKLVHVVSEPLAPPPLDHATLDEDVHAFHRTVRARMDALIQEALSYPRK